MLTLVTGGAGFIGSTVVDRLLAEGHTVRVLDDFSTGHEANLAGKPVEILRGDVRDRALAARAVAGAQAIFHLAARIGNVRSLEQPIEDSETNVLGTLTIVEAARGAGARTFVYSSSAAIFGELHEEAIDEGHPQEPESPYGVSKLAAEKHVLCYGKVHGLRAVCLRYFNVYGVRQRYDAYGNVIPIFARRLLERRPLTIFGDGTQTRDFVHVRDVADANYRAATTDGVGGVFNVGTGRSITISALAGLMQEVSGRRVGVEHAPPRPGEVLHCRARTAKIEEALGFAARTDFTQGLREYWGWFEANG